jgi:hypothetical protein
LWHYAVQGPPGFPFLTPNKPEKSKLSFFKTVVEVAAATFGVIHCNPWRGLVVGRTYFFVKEFCSINRFPKNDDKAIDLAYNPSLCTHHRSRG